jgi:hypothetical protein
VRFCVELPSWISRSQIPDRADSSRNIDAYVDELTSEERTSIIATRDRFLERLRAYDGSKDAAILFEPVALAAQVSSSSMSRAPAVITQGRSTEPRPPFGI